MDLSYILNSPDVERIASALEAIADDVIAAMTDKLDKNQGSAYAGKAMVVGVDGNIIPSDAVNISVDDTTLVIQTTSNQS